MTGPPTILPMGPTAVLVEGITSPAAYAIAVGLLVDRGELESVLDVVPAAETVLVTFSTPPDHCVIGPLLRSIRADDPIIQSREAVVVPVRYDGEDLAEVAAIVGLSTAAVAELHTSAEYVVAFCGFAPGFGYLTGLPEALHLPRRVTPRTRVPAGSVAIASEYSAVYPRSSPGGWHLLGTTSVAMFDAERVPPALLMPGVRVRFEAL